MYEKINYFMDIHEAYLEENYDEFDNEIGESKSSYWVRKLIGLGIIPTEKASGTKGGKFGAIQKVFKGADGKIDQASLKKLKPKLHRKGMVVKELIKRGSPTGDIKQGMKHLSTKAKDAEKTAKKTRKDIETIKKIAAA
jgi:DNA-binding transcriptional regulator GbsR (MarR family)